MLVILFLLQLLLVMPQLLVLRLVLVVLLLQMLREYGKLPWDCLS